MKIRISEVWNRRGESKELAVIEVIELGTHPARARVFDWIMENRPDLNMATGIDDHGFHAVAID